MDIIKDAAIRGVFVLEVFLGVLSGVEYADNKNMLISYSVSDFQIFVENLSVIEFMSTKLIILRPDFSKIVFGNENI
jgi:hypothetical protein